MSLTITVNGQSREFPGLTAPVLLAEVIAEMNLKGDRVAVEHNGEIAQRTRWAEVSVVSGDRLEVVHFVGGGGGIGARSEVRAPLLTPAKEKRSGCGPGIKGRVEREGSVSERVSGT